MLAYLVRLLDERFLNETLVELAEEKEEEEAWESCVEQTTGVPVWGDIVGLQDELCWANGGGEGFIWGEQGEGGWLIMVETADEDGAVGGVAGHDGLCCCCCGAVLGLLWSLLGAFEFVVELPAEEEARRRRGEKR